MMLPCPIEVNCPLAHPFEGALHADRAYVDVRHHNRDEQHGDRAMDDFSQLHIAYACSVEREHERGKLVAVNQCTNRSNALKRTTL